MTVETAFKRALIEAGIVLAFLFALKVLFGPTFGLVGPTTGGGEVMLALAFLYVGIRAFALAREKDSQ